MLTMNTYLKNIFKVRKWSCSEDYSVCVMVKFKLGTVVKLLAEVW